MNTLLRRIFLPLLAAPLALAALPALAQKLPAGKPVRIVVAYAAGGTTDIIARQLSVKLTDVLGQPVVVDNKPGGGGTIAGSLVATSAPDGLTLLMGGLDLATNPQLMAGKTTFAPTKDLMPVVPLTLGPLVLVVNPAKTRANTLAELIAMAKSQPGTLNYGSAGNGSINHLFGEVFKRAAKIEITHVPYRGAGPLLTDLLGGQINMAFVGTASARGPIAAGQLKALAVTGTEPQAGVPTFAQAGVPMPEADLGAWTGLFGPPGIPRETVAQINQAMNSVLAMPDVRAQLAQNGLVADPGTADMLQARLVSQTQSWGTLIRSANIASE